jgi:hypothetical protein
MLRIDAALVAVVLTLAVGAPAFAKETLAIKTTSGSSRPAHPQTKCWPHIYNAGIAKGHDAALAAAEANLICGGGDPR